MWFSARFPEPVQYPNANVPQAWASGAVLLLARHVAGASVDALGQRVAVKPLALPGLGRLALRGLPAGKQRFDLSITGRDGRAHVDEPELPPGWRLVAADR